MPSSRSVLSSQPRPDAFTPTVNPFLRKIQQAISEEVHTPTTPSSLSPPLPPASPSTSSISPAPSRFLPASPPLRKSPPPLVRTTPHLTPDIRASLGDEGFTKTMHRALLDLHQMLERPDNKGYLRWDTSGTAVLATDMRFMEDVVSPEFVAGKNGGVVPPARQLKAVFRACGFECRLGPVDPAGGGSEGGLLSEGTLGWTFRHPKFTRGRMKKIYGIAVHRHRLADDRPSRRMLFLGQTLVRECGGARAGVVVPIYGSSPPRPPPPHHAFGLDNDALLPSLPTPPTPPTPPDVPVGFAILDRTSFIRWVLPMYRELADFTDFISALTSPSVGYTLHTTRFGPSLSSVAWEFRHPLFGREIIPWRGDEKLRALMKRTVKVDEVQHRPIRLTNVWRSEYEIVWCQEGAETGPYEIPPAKWWEEDERTFEREELEEGKA